MTKPVVEIPRHSSFSQLSSMLKCGMQWYLERGLHLPSLENWGSVGGAAVHSATEVWDKNLLVQGACDTEPRHAETLFQAAFEAEIALREERTGTSHTEWRATGRASKEWPNKRDRFWWEKNGPLMIQRWITWRLNSDWEVGELITPDETILGIEVSFEVELGGVVVRGYIDRVMTRPGDRMILDIKTGMSKPDEEQLDIYALGVQQAAGVFPQWGCFWDGNTGSTSVPVQLNRRTDYLDAKVAGVRQMQEAGLYFPNPSNLCASCGVAEFCPAKGTRSHEAVMPWEAEIKLREPLALASDGMS